MSYDDLRSALIAHDDLERGGGATSDQVREAEGVLGDLPADYRRFLADYGFISIDAFEIYGLGDDVPHYLNVVAMTLSERAEARLREDLIAVMNDGGGNLYCLDTRARNSLGLMPVVFWDHEIRRTADTPIASSFSDWLLSLINA